MNTLPRQETVRPIEHMEVLAGKEVTDLLRGNLDGMLDKLGRPTLGVENGAAEKAVSFAAGDTYSTASAYRAEDGNLLRARIETRTKSIGGFKRTNEIARVVSFNRDDTISTTSMPVTNGNQQKPVSSDADVISFMNEFTGIVSSNTNRRTRARSMGKRALASLFDR